MKSLKWLLISSLAVSYVMVGSGSKTIHAEHNNIEFIQIKEGETIPLYKLKGTSLEGKEVKIIGDKLFVDGQNAAGSNCSVYSWNFSWLFYRWNSHLYNGLFWR